MFRHALVVAVVAAAPVGQPGTSLPPANLPLRLTGTAVDTSPGKSACLIRCTDLPAQGIYSPGQLACGVAMIEEIHREGVVVRNVKANRREWLTFGTARDPNPFPPAVSEAGPEAHVPPSTAPAPLAVQVSKAAVERHLANLSEVLESALAVPHYRGEGSGRTMDGFEISQVAEGGAAHAVGLRDGDVVLEVNGQPLDSVAAVMQLLGQARSLTEARLIVCRNGERVTLAVSVK